MGFTNYTRLEPGFTENHKVSELHDRAFRLHMIALDQCASHLTDGFVSDRRLAVCHALLGSRATRWDRELVAAGLWDQVEGGWQIHDYLKHNLAAGDVKAAKDTMRERGLKGAAARWGGDARSNASSIPPSIASKHPASMMPVVGSRQEKKTSGAVTAVRPEEPLPISHELLSSRLIGMVGDDADERTAAVIRGYARRLPEGSLAKVVESLGSATDVKNRGRYVVGALKSELGERAA